MAWKAKPISNRISALKGFTAPVVGYAVQGFVEQLDDNVKEGNRSGSKDYRTGRRRSVLGEFPQEQTGQLRSAITSKRDSDSIDGLSWLVGFDASKAIRSSMKGQAALEEYLGYIEGYGAAKVAASRHGLEMTGESGEVITRMKQVMAKLLPGKRFMWGR